MAQESTTVLETYCTASELGPAGTSGDALNGVRTTERAGRLASLILGGLLTASVLLFTRSLVADGPVDDAFIVFRYAENVAAGNGPVFNVGERVEGVTSPLWLWLVTGCRLIGITPETGASWFGALFGVMVPVAVMLVFRALGRDQHWSFGLAAATGLASCPAFAGWSGAGLETPLTALLLLVSAAATLGLLEGRARSLWAGVSLTLLALVRPEGVAVLAVVFFFLLWESIRERLSVAQILEFLAPVTMLLAFLAWRFYFYGDVVPNTAHAKLGPSMGALLRRGIRYVEGFVTAYQLIAWTGVLLFALFFFAGARDRWRVSGIVAFAATWVTLVTIAGGDHFPLHRFLVPVIPLLVLSLALSVAVIVARLSVTAAQTRAIAGGFLLLLLANWWTVYRQGGGGLRAEAERARRWSEVGRWAKEHLHPDARIAAYAVGAVGYESRLHLVDVLGLTERTIARRGEVVSGAPPGHDRFLPEYLRSVRPEFIVLPDSGQVGLDASRDPVREAKKYSSALSAFVGSPVTLEMFAYREYALPSGRAVQVLQRRDVVLEGVEPVWEWEPPGSV